MNVLTLFLLLFPLSTASSYPQLHSPPVLDPPRVIDNGTDFTQGCHVRYNGSDAGFIFTWLFDDMSFKTTNLSSGVTTAFVKSADWKGHVGEKLSCQIEAYYIKSPDVISPPTKSNEYMGTIQINPSPVYMTEGKDEDLTITSTLPIVCGGPVRGDCHLDLEMVVREGNAEHIFLKKECSVRLKPTDWDNTTNTAVVQTTLASVIDPVDKDQTQLNIGFAVISNFSRNDIWDSYETGGTQVYVTDSPHEMCMLIGDPHIIGLNHNRVFMAYQPGDYLMYRSIDIHGIFLQVQTRHMSYKHHGSYVCGVAVQYDATLVEINMCTPLQGMAAPVVTQGNHKADDVRIYLCNIDYEIVTVNGVRVSIITHPFYMDVKLHLPPSYSNTVHGTCTYNGNLTDLSYDLVKEYRLDDKEDLFGNASSRFFQQNTSTSRTPEVYCQCGTSSNADCSPFKRVKDPMSPVEVQHDGTVRLKDGCRRVAPLDVDPELDTFTPTDPEMFGIPQVNFSSHPLTQPVVYGKCLKTLLDFVPPHCIKEYGYLLDTFRTICHDDYEASGKFRFQNSAVQGFKWMCEELTLKNSSKYTVLVNGTHVPPQDVITEFCPNSCHGRGHCVGGKCVCNENILGKDCASSLTFPPFAFGVKGSAICQMSRRYCENPVLITANLNATDNLKANLTLVKVVNGYPVVTKEVYTLDAVYLNTHSVLLPMSQFLKSLQNPTAVGFVITVTDDGVRYSKPTAYYMYDDKCQDCAVRKHPCILKSGTCEIDGTCYLSAELNPLNKTETCNPDKNSAQWSQLDGKQHPVLIG